MQNVQNTLDGTVQSVANASREFSKIPSLLRAFESIGVQKLQITDPGVLQDYIAQTSILTTSQQKAASGLVVMDSGMKSLSKQYQSFLKDGVNLNSVLYEQQLATTSVSQAVQKQIMTQSGLVDTTGKYTLAVTSNIEATIKNTSAFKGLSAAEQKEVTDCISATVAKQAQTGATVQLTTAQKALNAVLGIGKQALISLGITALVWGIQKAVAAFKELNPTMQDLTNRAQEAKTAYEDTQTTLGDYKSKLEELEGKKRLVREGKITDPEEIAEIDNQSKYIEAQIKLYEELLEKKAAVANANAWEAANKKSYADMNHSYSVEDDPNGIGVGYDPEYVDPSEHLTQLIEHYNELSNSIAEVSQAWNDGEISEQEYTTQTADLADKMSDTKDQINNTYDVISGNFNTAIDDGSDKFNQLKEKTDASTAAYMDFQSSIGGVIEAQEELAQVTNDGNAWDVDTTQELADFMSKLSDSSSDLYDKTKALTSAYNDMYTSQKLSSDSIQSLISAYPDLINQMETENGVTTISKDILCEKFDAMKGAMVATIESEIQATQTAINEANTRIATYQAEIKALTTLYSAIGNIASSVKVGDTYNFNGNMPKELWEAAQQYNAVNDAMADAKNTLSDANEKLAEQQKALEVLNNLTLPNYAGATKGASSGSKGAAKAAKEHKKALEAQKKEAEKAKKALENYSKTLKAQGDAVIKVLDKRKDALEKDKKERDKAWDKQKEQLEEEKKLQDEVYDKQKEALQDKKKALQDANDEEDRAIKLAQLQDALEKARTQRTKRVYEHDTGFEWKVDDSAVSDAQNNLDDQQRTWKREDAIDAVEKEIEAIEKLKDAYDDEVEAAIDAIEKQMDAYDDSIDAQIDKIEEMKDKYQEVLDLIGMSWEEYQAMLDATALAEGMSLDAMGENLVGFKENVIQNMKEIAAAEAEVQRITDALSGLDSSSSGSGGGGGGGGVGSVGTNGSKGYAGLSDNLKKVADSMSINIEKLNQLKSREAELKDQIDSGNLSTDEKTDKYRELADVQQQIVDKEADLNYMAETYIETLANETQATDEYRQSAIEYLQDLNTQYGANYDEILQKLQTHVEDLRTTQEGTAEQYETMGKTVEEFKTQVSNYLSGPAGLTNDFQKLQQQVENTATAIVESCNKAVEGLKDLKKAKKEEGAGSSAIGTRNSRSGWYHLDESGPEIVVHDGKPSSGRYTYLERGDQVLPASYSKNLWDMGSNPSEWFERQYSKFNRMDNSKVAYAGNSTVYSPSFTGDIVISNPVANSDDLARGLTQNLPASFMQAIGVRM